MKFKMLTSKNSLPGLRRLDPPLSPPAEIFRCTCLGKTFLINFLAISGDSKKLTRVHIAGHCITS